MFYKKYQIILIEKKNNPTLLISDLYIPIEVLKQEIFTQRCDSKLFACMALTNKNMHSIFKRVFISDIQHSNQRPCNKAITECVKLGVNIDPLTSTY